MKGDTSGDKVPRNPAKGSRMNRDKGRQGAQLRLWQNMTGHNLRETRCPGSTRNGAQELGNGNPALL